MWNNSTDGNEDGVVADRLRKYLHEDMFRLKGGTHPLDAYCFAALLLHQNQTNVIGSVAEIGVGEGRSFFLLAQSLVSGQRWLAADLFDEGPVINGEHKKLTDFKATAARLNLTFDTGCVLVGPSERITRSQIANTVGAVRFFSIDGGHMLEHVRSDSLLAQSVLTEDGVIVFDDFGNPEWPEVTVGVLEFLKTERQKCVPFAITKGKLYVCHPDYQARYINALKGSPFLKRFPKKEVRFVDAPTLWLHQGLPDRILFQGLHWIGAGRLANGVAVHALGNKEKRAKEWHEATG